jgi:hypothetical protein
MKPSKKKQIRKHEEHELSEEALDAVQGGALGPEDIHQIQQVANQAAEHHGVGIGATAVDYAIGAGVDFGANALGQALTKPKKQQPQQ